MTRKSIVLAVCLLFVAANLVEAQKYSGGSRSSSSSGSRSSFGGSSRSSGSSSGSRSSFGSGSSSKYSGGSSSGSRSSFGSGSSSKYSGGSSSKPSGGGLFGGSSSSGSKYSGGSSSSKPSASSGSGGLFGGSSSPTNSTKPAARSSGGLSEKARANEMQRSRRQYVESQKATAPPKPTYTTSDGKTGTVKADTKVAETIRSKPTSYYRPEEITRRTEVHVTHHHYQHPYTWYYSQPPIYIGGGYNSAFWYMMMEWDAERRARWLYHNQGNIEREAYERGMKDAKVAAEIAKLEAAKAARDPNYIDPEFADDPSIIMDPNYVEAVYNPEVVEVEESSGVGAVVMWFFIIVFGLLFAAVLVWLIYWLVFKVRFGGN